MSKYLLETDSGEKFEIDVEDVGNEKQTTVGKPSLLDQTKSLAKMTPAYQLGKTAIGAYKTIREPLVDIATKTAPLPSILNKMGDRPITVMQPNPISILSPSLAMGLPMQKTQTSPQALGREIAGFGVDTLLTAGIMDGGPSIARSISNIPTKLKFIPGVTSKIKESFSAGKKLKNVAEEMASVENQLENLRVSVRPEAQANLTAKAVEQAEANKVILDNMGDKLTTTYGKAQDIIESKITAKATQDDVVQIIKDSLAELDTPALKGTEVSKTLNNLLSKYSPEEGVIQLDPKKFTLNELKQFKNTVLGKFTPGRSEENLAKTIFRSKYGKFLEQYAPEMLRLNSEFAGHINSFKKASTLFQTTNEMLVARGAKALEAIAKSSPTNPSYIDNLNILSSLEKSSGRFPGAGHGKLTGNLSNEVNKIKAVDKEIGALVKKKYLLQHEESRLKELKSIRNQVLLRIGGALGVGGAVGGAISISRFGD